jgi:HSP20 family protein
VGALQHEVNRLFSDFWGRGGDGDTLAGDWTPAVDILEGKDEYVLTMALPGMDQQEIKVNLENNTLTISGERKLEHEDKRDNYSRIEQFYGSFNRSFTLPNTIDPGKVQARMDKGILTVTLPRREETKPKAIEVKVN